MEEPKRLSGEASPAGRLLGAAAAGSERVAPGAELRVWQSMQVERPAPQARVWTFGALAATAGAVAVFLLVRPDAPTPRASTTYAMAEAAGDVQVRGAGGEPLGATAGEVLPGGARLRVGAGGEALVSAGGAQVALGAGASVRLEQTGLALAEGDIGVQAGASLASVAAGALRIEATSALFSVSATAGRIRVFVEQGEVRISGGTEPVSLHAGSAWSSAGPAPESNERQRSLARRAAGQPLAAIPPVPSAAVPAPAPVPAPAAAQPAPAPVRTAAAPHSPPGFKVPEAAHRATRRRTVLARAPLQPQPPLVTATIPESDAALHERAHLREREGRWAEAASLYAELSLRGGPRAESSLYELGRLRLRFLHQPAGALAALAEHDRRFPSGALALESSLTAVEARLALGGGEPALHAMDSFLSRFSGSERAGEVRWLRASLLRDRGDCAGAEPDLRALLDDPARGDDALFALASCARNLGRVEEARALLRLYQERYPAGRHRTDVEAALGADAHPGEHR